MSVQIRHLVAFGAKQIMLQSVAVYPHERTIPLKAELTSFTEQSIFSIHLCNPCTNVRPEK